jgi:hypothetical protein
MLPYKVGGGLPVVGDGGSVMTHTAGSVTTQIIAFKYSGRTKYSVRTKYSARPYRQQNLFKKKIIFLKTILTKI